VDFAAMLSMLSVSGTLIYKFIKEIAFAREENVRTDSAGQQILR
jgi:hypothetical protein